jgi:hypothetical protein
MQVGGETYVDKDGVEKLRRIRFDSREIEVAENIGQWHGKDYHYFKVKSGDGAAYILRHNESGNDWDIRSGGSDHLDEWRCRTAPAEGLDDGRAHLRSNRGALTRALAMELAPIRGNAVCPGVVKTECMSTRPYMGTPRFQRPDFKSVAYPMPLVVQRVAADDPIAAPEQEFAV